MKRLVYAIVAIVLVGCAGTPDRPPFEMNHTGFPDGWRRSDLERDDEQLAEWRILLPREADPPRGAGLRAETYKTLLESGYTLRRFYDEAIGIEHERCPGSRSQLLEETDTRLVYESTSPYESRCWTYQLVRLEQGRKAIHALAVYAHDEPSPEERAFWIDIVGNAIFDPRR